MSAYLNPRIAFALGEDYAHYALPLPRDVNADVVRGYEVQRERRPFHRFAEVDRFTRKWLQLRTNAWRRNRAFAADVTPEYLRELDSATCPFSDVVLTAATGQGSDWSIDRICNDGGYVRGNLVAMSARVNTAKGSLSCADILSIQAAGRTVPGLTENETARLASLSAAFAGDRYLAVRAERFIIQLPLDILRPLSVVFQVEIDRLTGAPAAARSGFWHLLRVGSDPRCGHAIAELEVAVRAAAARRRKAGAPRYLFEDQACWEAFRQYWAVAYEVDSDSLPGMVTLMTRGGGVSTDDWASHIGAATQGYAEA